MSIISGKLNRTTQLLTPNQPDVKSSNVVAGLSGVMRVNLKKGMTCGVSFHAGYFILLAMKARKK